MAKREGFKLVSYKLPENLIETLKAEAEKRGASQTALIIQGLQHVLGIASDTAPNAALDAADIDERLESAIAPLRLEVDALKAAIEALQNVPRKAPVHSDVQGCPKCGSSNIAPWGKGRLRADGSQGRKIMCNTCKKVSTIG